MREVLSHWGAKHACKILSHTPKWLTTFLVNAFLKMAGKEGCFELSSDVIHFTRLPPFYIEELRDEATIGVPLTLCTLSPQARMCVYIPVWAFKVVGVI